MKPKIITISRQYAAYGRTIAKILSEATGLPYYDKDFVKKTAEESGYDAELIEKEGELLTKGSRLFDKIMGGVHIGYVSSQDEIFVSQCKAILSLSKEPCIIVGRCANYVLREAGIPSFDIFLYADPADRRERAAQLNPDVKDIDEFIAKQDEMRRNYYKKYTNTEMGEATNYSICLDVGTLGLEKTKEILLSILVPEE